MQTGKRWWKSIAKGILALIVGVGFANLAGALTVGQFVLFALIGAALFWAADRAMGRFFPERRRSVLLLSALVAAAVSAALPVGTPHVGRGVEDGLLCIEPTQEKNPASYDSEVWITHISSDADPVDLRALELPAGWIHHEGGAIVAVTYGPTPEPLYIPFAGRELDIVFGHHPYSGIVRVAFAGQEESIDLYKPGESEYRHYRFLTAVTAADRAVMGCSHLTIGMLLWFAAVALCRLLEGRRWRGFVYTAVSALLWLGSSRIVPARSSMAVITVLTILAYRYALRAKEAEGMRPYLKGGLHAACIGLSAVVSFCLFGYRLFLAGEYISVDAAGVVWFVLGAVWAYPVVLSVLYALEHVAGRALAAEPESVSERRVFLLSAGAFMACMLIGWAGFYPGGYVEDSIMQLRQVYNGGYDAWHPVMHTLLMQALIWIWDDPAITVLAQMFMFSLLAGKVSVLLHRIGLGLKTILIAVVIFALLPNQMITNICPLKDFPFTYAMLWATLLLFELVLDVRAIRKPWYIVQMIAALFLIFAMRHNGIVPLVFVFVLLAVLTAKHWQTIRLRAVAVIVCVAAMIGVLQGPVMTALDVKENFITPYVTMFCAVGSCVNKDKTFSEETTAKLEEVMPMEDWKAYYSRFEGHDRYMFQRPGAMDLTGFSAGEAFSIYLEALFKYPLIVIKDRLDGANLLWDITQPGESFNKKTFAYIVVDSAARMEREGYRDGQLYFKQSFIAKAYRYLTDISVPGEYEADQITNVILWRSGIYLMLFFALIIFWAKNKLNRLWWAAMPFVGNTAGMLLVLYHQTFRYIYYVQLLVIALTVMTFVFYRSKYTDRAKELTKGAGNE